jgi:hypothetical protein
MRFRGAVIAVFLLVSCHAQAQTPAEREACHDDAIRLCRPQLDGMFVTLRVLACLVSRRDQLSPKCQAVLKAHGV